MPASAAQPAVMLPAASAFSAEVYLNGRRAGDVRNDGQGGPHYYQGDFSALHAYAAGLPPEDVDLGNGHVISIQPDADLLVSKALDDWLDERDARSTPAGFEALLAAMEHHGNAEGTEAQLSAACGFLRLAFGMLPAKRRQVFLGSSDVLDYINNNGVGASG